jgi:hypothetical protein
VLRRWVIVVAGLVGASACRKDEPGQPTTAAPRASASTKALATRPSPSAQPLATAHAAVSAAPAPERPQPAVLDAAGQRRARAYLSSLAAGRKATVARDYAKAIEQFGKCLESAPADPRALAERGYARLLSGQLPEAEADLAAAAKLAPSAALLSQILHNQLQVAKKRGDERSAARFEAAKQELAQARRLASGVTCGFGIEDGSLSPQPAVDLDAALLLVRQTHAQLAEIDTNDVKLGGVAASSDDASEASLRAFSRDGKLDDGAWTLTTEGGEGTSAANHVIISSSGQLHVFPGLSVGRLARCGQQGLAELRLGGGGATPWHIYRKTTLNMTAYLCEYDDHSVSPCGAAQGPGEGTPVQSFCAWVSSEVALEILDPKSLTGLRRATVSAQPNDDGPGVEPAHLLDYEWHSENATLTACGSRQLLPYTAP